MHGIIKQGYFDVYMYGIWNRVNINPDSIPGALILHFGGLVENCKTDSYAVLIQAAKDLIRKHSKLKSK